MQTGCLKLVARSQNRGIVLAADDVRLERDIRPMLLLSGIAEEDLPRGHHRAMIKAR